ncbi:phosphoadenylyl-sulfate reductase [Xanthobacter agilis]|jgi:phosphoadenosine phosphosulfate reductase|uniref:Adenosine 5'-phosphosulfate reductase n=1 Tax=Xanthobacter agilis TaxID=47492 RepID=A0ABU0LE72_XANAG|nr:phosphoadenylyl-sulfate reductase [Xanthobacter agilis]MDQ0505451.1 phosphoadenosine phosphosulfate reductase [Xanthobacter agilis]
MNAVTTAVERPLGLPLDVFALDAALRRSEPEKIIEIALALFPGRIAAVSSFGTESVVLLHMIAQVSKAAPILFLDTGHLFPETLAYRDQLTDLLGLTQVLTIPPDPEALAARDPEAGLWSEDPDACCAVRKVEPLARALAPYGAWINGRKRYQAQTRSTIPVVEGDGARVKFNPLATLGREDLIAYMDSRNLPHHPLEKHGFLSIGCMPCTSRVKPGEDPRAGRWRGRAKTECGIHLGEGI